jgi:hypothetical protein
MAIWRRGKPDALLFAPSTRRLRQFFNPFINDPDTQPLTNLVMVAGFTSFQGGQVLQRILFTVPRSRAWQDPRISP